jgi:ABC-type nitrate/sulfonate/bicarbonate transport system permease component
MSKYIVRRLLLSVAALLGSWVFLLLVWECVILIAGGGSYVAKSPIDVWNYLFAGLPGAPTSPAQNREQLLALLLVTLRDAGIGFAFGVASSVVLAVVFSMVPALEAAFLPLAMVMRTIPLVGFAPIIYIIFGNGTTTIALIGTIIVFFPILINMAVGLASASPQSLDVVRVYGGNRWTATRMVAIPTALPNLFASVKIALPFSIVGAMLYEWLFSLRGLGGQISVANADSQYAETWSIVVIITAASILLYNLVTFIETPVLAAWGPRAGVSSAS